MFQKLRLPICFVFVLLVASTALRQPFDGAQDKAQDIAYAQGPVAQHSDPFWQVSYWNNMTLSGAPVVQGAEAHLDWDWGSRSPHASVNADHFSARWTRYIDVTTGTYRFTATSDDGIRVYVDNRLVIDQWHDHPARTYTGDVSLTAGHHLVAVEYYENMGYAVAKVSWVPVPDTPHNWRGEYFNNRWLNGSPVLVRDDLNLGFNWSYGSPAAGIPSDNFSVRWTRTFHFEPGSYRFITTTDDGVRLWVNGHLLIDQWHDQSLSPHNGTIYLSGDAPIKMEYYEHGGLAAAWLTWDRTDHDPPPPPDAVVVDDADQGFVKGGSATGWHTAAEGYGGRLTWTRNNDRVRYNYNWARWYPDLSPGRYEVFVYIPERYSTTSSARYWVSHRDGSTLRRVDQSANGNRWVSLGTYWFRGTRDDYVSLADVTYEPYASRLMAFDAAKWEPR
jgi:hypothetical protein